MPADKIEVVIDTDFFLKFTKENKESALFLAVMEELNLLPVMHAYVYRTELFGQGVAKELVDNGTIKIYDYCDFIDKANQETYETLFRMAYKHFNGFFDSSEDCYTFHRTGHDLGEIRSSLMAWLLDINLFMSNDRGAKYFVESKLNSSRRSIQVHNVLTVLETLSRMPNNIRWKDIRWLVKLEVHKEDAFECIRSGWIK